MNIYDKLLYNYGIKDIIINHLEQAVKSFEKRIKYIIDEIRHIEHYKINNDRCIRQIQYDIRKFNTYDTGHAYHAFSLYISYVRKACMQPHRRYNNNVYAIIKK